MQKLTGGYEYRTFWFEIFEAVRKVLLVGVPCVFPERGGTAQLFWGLLVCFVSASFYMMAAPYIEDSDDHLAQLAQLQVYLTLTLTLQVYPNPNPNPNPPGLPHPPLVARLACGAALGGRRHYGTPTHLNREALKRTRRVVRRALPRHGVYACVAAEIPPLYTASLACVGWRRSPSSSSRCLSVGLLAYLLTYLLTYLPTYLPTCGKRRRRRRGAWRRRGAP